MIGGFVTASIFHGLHNLGATLAGANCLTLFLSLIVDWGGILILGVVISLIWRQEKSWIAGQLTGEVTVEAYQTLTSWGRWQGLRWDALLRGDWVAWRRLGRLRKAATELAFSKQRLGEQSDDPVTQRDIEQYRRQLVELGVTQL